MKGWKGWHQAVVLAFLLFGISIAASIANSQESGNWDVHVPGAILQLVLYLGVALAIWGAGRIWRDRKRR